MSRYLLVRHQGTFPRLVHTTTMLRSSLQTAFTCLLCTLGFVRYFVRSQIRCYPFWLISIRTYYASCMRDKFGVCSICHAFHPISSSVRLVRFIYWTATSLSNLCVCIVLRTNQNLTMTRKEGRLGWRLTEFAIVRMASTRNSLLAINLMIIIAFDFLLNYWKAKAMESASNALNFSSMRCVTSRYILNKFL